MVELTTEHELNFEDLEKELENEVVSKFQNYEDILKFLASIDDNEEKLMYMLILACLRN